MSTNDEIPASVERVVGKEPPVRPRMVWCAGLNYRDHAREVGMDIPFVPTFFVKSPGSIVGHDAEVVIPAFVEQPGYEGELAVIIGRRVRDLEEDEALSAVAGITCANDVSARDHQFATTQWSWSKSFDTFCPLGPVVVPLEGLDVGDLAVTTTVNGRVVQDSSTRRWVFSLPRLLTFLSRGVTLEPGDVVLTGTSAGVGMARDGRGFLADGDVVEVTVEGIGTLRNRVVRPAASTAVSA